MKRKSPISVELVQFYAYERYDDAIVTYDIEKFPYDNRRDFAVDNNSLAGIAAKLQIWNSRCDGGVRRKVSLRLIDLTLRCEVVSEIMKVNLPGDSFCNMFINFPIESTALKAGHDFKLLVSDTATSEVLTEGVFHLLDPEKLGHPTKWYEICDGGIRPAWKSITYKVLNTDDYHDYYIRFNLVRRRGCNLPAILPELELRLYYPNSEYVTAQFKEPKFFGIENYEADILTVEFPFETGVDTNGIYYAELLCMEYPVAGFVFDTQRDDVSGEWFDAQIVPLDEYTPEAAAMRLKQWLPPTAATSSALNDDDFDHLLEDFINSQMEDDETEEQAEQETEKVEEPEITSETEPAEINDEERRESLLASLDHLTGLHNVKKKLTVYENVVRFNKMRLDCGLPVAATPLHAMFLGSPGTGKTTVAKLMGRMLRKAGILSKGHVVVRERASLLGKFYHSEAEKTLAAIEEAQGGILFIDEAYQLHQPSDPKDPGKFVIETLLTALADESKRDWMLVLAGYPDEMKRMFDLNPGFKSRIPDSNIYVFDDFTESELMEIAQNYFARNSYTLSADAQTALAQRLKADYEHREKNFGNARHIINMIQTEILPSMAVRVISEGGDDKQLLTQVQVSDIPEPVHESASTRLRVGFIR